jgi:hypothetical protein
LTSSNLTLYHRSGVCVSLPGHTTGHDDPNNGRQDLVSERFALSVVVLVLVVAGELWTVAVHRKHKNHHNGNTLHPPPPRPSSCPCQGSESSNKVSCLPRQVTAAHCLAWLAFVASSLVSTWAHVTAYNEMVAMATLLVPTLPAALTPLLMMAQHASRQRRLEMEGRLRRLLQAKKRDPRGAL